MFRLWIALSDANPPKIAMSSMTPLAGRLSQIFTARNYVVFSSTLLSVGLFITAAARSLPMFLLGRAVSGCGSGGLMSTCIILVLDLTSKRRRGLFVGLINAGVTTGVSSGAVLAGLLTQTFGWVRFLRRPKSLADRSSESSSGFRHPCRWFWAQCFSTQCRVNRMTDLIPGRYCRSSLGLTMPEP